METGVSGVRTGRAGPAMAPAMWAKGRLQAELFGAGDVNTDEKARRSYTYQWDSRC